MKKSMKFRILQKGTNYLVQFEQGTKWETVSREVDQNYWFLKPKKTPWLFPSLEYAEYVVKELQEKFKNDAAKPIVVKEFNCCNHSANKL
jgi:hypothetical protein